MGTECHNLHIGGPYERLTWILQPSTEVAIGVAAGLHEPQPSVLALTLELELAVFVTVLETMTVFEFVEVAGAVAGALQSCQVEVEPSSLL